MLKSFKHLNKKLSIAKAELTAQIEEGYVVLKQQDEKLVQLDERVKQKIEILTTKQSFQVVLHQESKQLPFVFMSGA